MGDSYGRHQGRAQAGNDPSPLRESEPLLPGASTLGARLRFPARLFLLNTVMMASYWVVFALPEIGWLRALWVMYLIFIAPGLWVAPLLREYIRDWVAVFFGVVLASTLCSLVGLVVRLAAGLPPSALSAWGTGVW